MNLSDKIRALENYPIEGVTFRDITTLLKDKDAFKCAIDEMVERIRDKKVDKIIGIEARGFIVGAPIAYALGCGFIPVRKPGKLPHDTISAFYDLEYGSDSVEIHCDSIEKGENIVIIDDLLATGGTSKAVGELVDKLEGNIVSYLFLIELVDLDGRKQLDGYNVESIIKY